MTIKKSLIVSVIAAAAVTMTSCLGTSEQEQKMTYNYTDCFNVVTTKSTGETEIRVSPAYSFEFEYVSGKATVTLTNISLPGVNGSLSFKLEDLKFSYDKNGNYIIQGIDLVPKGNGAAYTFNNFSLKFLDRIMDNSLRIPAYYINYTINNEYTVNVVGTNNYYFGTTEVSDGSEKEPFSTIDTYYVVKLDPQSKKSTIDFKRARFSDKMPMSLNFTLRDLPFTVTKDGYTIDRAEATTPFVNNETPNNSYDITNLHLSAITYTGGTMTFNCNPPKMGEFAVKASLAWMTPNLTPEL